MSSPNARNHEVVVVIPQRLINRAMRESEEEVDEILAYDEGAEADYPLYYADESRFFSLARWGLVTAIVGSIVIFTGLQVADSHIPAAISQPAVATGLQNMSATELIQSVGSENRTVYWLNSKPGDSYINISLANGIDQVIYRPEGADAAQFDVIVETYASYSLYESQPHPLLGANGRTTTLDSGATVTYNSVAPHRAVVQFPTEPQVVVINYPTTQAIPTIINDATNLVPIK